MTVGPDGNIYVADYSLRHVQVYTPSGQHVRQIVQPSVQEHTPGHLGCIGSVAVSANGLVYILYPSHRCVQVFSSTGTFLHEIVGLVRPRAIAVTDTGMSL